MEERRRDFRMIEENRVVIKMPGAEGLEGGEAVGALVKDLSLGGAKVETDRSFDTGLELKMTLYLSRSRQVVKVHGRVKWIKEIDHGLYWMGIEFLHEIPGSVMSLISHLFGKHTNIPAVIHR